MYNFIPGILKMRCSSDLGVAVEKMRWCFNLRFLPSLKTKEKKRNFYEQKGVYSGKWVAYFVQT